MATSSVRSGLWEGPSIRCRFYGVGRVFQQASYKDFAPTDLGITAIEPVREARLCFILVAKVVASFFFEPAILSTHFLR